MDSWVFERDVDRGFLGEAFAIQLVLPYLPLIGQDYLKSQEVNVKKRLILEAIENLVLSFPELFSELRIKPEYFLYESLLSRARLFPPMFYTLLNFFQADLESKNVNHAMIGFRHALTELEKEGVIYRTNGFLRISVEFARQVSRRRLRLTSFMKSIRKVLFMTLLYTFPKIFSFVWQIRDFILRFPFAESWSNKSSYCFKDSKSYLFLPTANGLVPLASRVNVEDLIRRSIAVNSNAKIEINRLGGILNDVYLIKAVMNGEVRKVVMKSFKDWSGVKWFPLILWTIGTKKFALLGSSRLERECAINQFLHSKGVDVPKLLSISSHERLIFMEYVDGESLEKIIKRILDAETGDKTDEYLMIVKRAGEALANIHALGVSLGDAKPENMVVRNDGRICLMDFEQASKGGDKAWDIAEFIYFIGHYLSPFEGVQRAELIAESFINGYLTAGGDPTVVKAAGKPKYTRVFSLFVFPNVILTLSKLCQNVDKMGRINGQV
ncbi:MAG: AarF/UbiB family protein [Candidatus Bathyarchaeota archaeon]|nr:AarF/UbiB family protein [Candidatus Bathyarchaeota archaeon]